jgi:hypothetical protein
VIANAGIVGQDDMFELQGKTDGGLMMARLTM